MTEKDVAGGGAGRTGGPLDARSEAFRQAQQFAAEIAREGRRPGRYEIAVTAEVWDGGEPGELLLAGVVYTWRWYEPASAGEPAGSASAANASVGGSGGAGSAGG